MNAPPANNARGILLMVLAIFLFAVLLAVTKHLSQDYSVWQLLWARFAFDALFIVCIFHRRVPTLLRPRAPALQWWRSFLMATAAVPYFYALKFLPLADVSAVLFLTPIMVTALSGPMLGERVRRRRWMGVVLGFTGALIVIRPAAEVAQWAVILPLLSAVARAFYQLSTRQLSGRDHPYTSTLYEPLVGVLVFTGVLPFVWTTPDATGWALMILLGVAGAVGHYVLLKAMEVAAASVIAPFNYLGLLWATLFGYVLFGDLPDIWTGVGAAVIVGSGFYIFYHERGQRSPAPRAGRRPAD
ncbi:MAG: DMT family transporter [Proteobacteria bacterium]|nr:DMT family transporter [Pseudomonadota bacterium]